MSCLRCTLSRPGAAADTVSTAALPASRHPVRRNRGRGGALPALPAHPGDLVARHGAHGAAQRGRRSHVFLTWALLVAANARLNRSCHRDKGSHISLKACGIRLSLCFLRCEYEPPVSLTACARLAAFPWRFANCFLFVGWLVCWGGSPATPLLPFPVQLRHVLRVPAGPGVLGLDWPSTVFPRCHLLARLRGGGGSFHVAPMPIAC